MSFQATFKTCVSPMIHCMIFSASWYETATHDSPFFPYGIPLNKL